MVNKNNIEFIWKDRKRILFGLPWSFTIYKLTEEKLYVETGFLSKKEEEIRLYRIMDLTLNRPLSQRIFGLGTIHCCSADKSTPEFYIRRIKNSREIKNLLSDLVEKQREAKRVVGREFMSDGDFDHDEM
ncbi:MAG: PH domain-containing protein [Ruminococcus sp.]|nr:PH domain-containing protein [Ruminococcus sp.]